MVVAFLLAMAGAPAATEAAQPGVVLPNPGGATTVAQVQASGARHVRVFASWKMLEQNRGQLTPFILSGYDDLANRMKAAGIGVNLVVVQTPAWATQSGADSAPPPVGAYADFMRRLAGHFKGRVTGYEIWNEPDGTTFWQGGASPAGYTALLKAAYSAVKGADPAAKVGVGGLVGNDYNYVGGLYDAGAKGSFDFVGVHTDTACNRTDPREAARDVDGRISRWSFTGYREVHETMVDHGDDKPIWMTELGWSVTSAKCPASPTEPAGVGTSTAATFLSHAYACMANDPYVEVGSWFSLADFGAQDLPGFRYGLFDSRGAARPALAAFQRAGSLAPDRGCGLQVDRGGARITVNWPADNKNVSGDLRYSVAARDDHGLRTLTLLVDGRRIRQTARSSMKGLWVGWRKLPYGPHQVTVKAKDDALNVTTRSIPVNKVRYGDGEPVRTRIAVGVYGNGKKRIAAGKLYTRPGVARRFLAGQMTVAFERKAGRWRPTGSAAGGSVSGAVKVTRKFKPGKYRVVIRFGGFRSFRPAVARRSFTVR